MICARIAAFAALAFPALAITNYTLDVEKQPSATYQLWKYDQVGNELTQITGGGHYSDTEVVTDARELPAGCYGIVAGAMATAPSAGYELNIVGSYGDANVTVAPGDSVTFSRGGAFCDLSSAFDKCMSNRNGLLPAITCRNVADLTTTCGIKSTAGAYTKAASQCNPSDLKPMTLYLVFKPNVDAADEELFRQELLAALAVLLDLYSDAFGSVTIQSYDGFDVIEVEFTAFLAEEVADILTRLTQANLDKLISMVPGLKGTTLEAFGSSDGQGDNATVPANVQTAIDNLQLVCADGTAPAVDGTCADGSTPTTHSTTPAPANTLETPAPTPALGSSTSSSSTDANCADGTSGVGCTLTCKNGAKPNKAGKCVDTPTTDDDASKNNGKNSSSTDGGSSGGLSGGAKAGIAIGCILGAAVLAAGGATMMKKRRAKQAAAAKAAAASAAAVPMA